MTARATVTGADLARALSNALAFVPARAQAQLLRLTVASDQVRAAGSDGYAAGFDHCQATVESPTSQFPQVALARDAWAELESDSRAMKKEVVILTVEASRVALATPDGEQQTWETVPLMGEAWEFLDNAFARQEHAQTGVPAFVAFDPALFSRFSKVKAEHDRVMDLWFAGADAPALVKIGPTFRGLVMPVHREAAAQYVEDGLW